MILSGQQNEKSNQSSSLSTQQKNESRILHTMKKAVKLQILRNSEMHAITYIEVLKTSWGLMDYLPIFANVFLKKENYLMGSYTRDLTNFFILF